MNTPLPPDTTSLDTDLHLGHGWFLNPPQPAMQFPLNSGVIAVAYPSRPPTTHDDLTAAPQIHVHAPVHVDELAAETLHPGNRTDRLAAVIVERLLADQPTGTTLIESSRGNGDGWLAHLTHLHLTTDGHDLLIAVLTAAGGNILTATVPFPPGQLPTALQLLSTLEHAPHRLIPG